MVRHGSTGCNRKGIYPYLGTVNGRKLVGKATIVMR